MWSAFPLLPVLHALLYETHESSVSLFCYPHTKQSQMFHVAIGLLFQHCSHFIHRFARVMLHASLSSDTKFPKISKNHNLCQSRHKHRKQHFWVSSEFSRRSFLGELHHYLWVYARAKLIEKAKFKGRRLVQLVERAPHVLRLCSGPRFDSQPGSLCCVPLPLSLPVHSHIFS